MAVKFEKTGYSSEQIQRYAEGKSPLSPPDGQASVSTLPHFRRLVVLVAIALVFIMTGETFRQTAPIDGARGTGKVLVKRTLQDEKGRVQFLLGLQFLPEDGEVQQVVVECPEALWRTLREGDAVAVTYHAESGMDRLKVVDIAPLGEAVEL